MTVTIVNEQTREIPFNYEAVLKSVVNEILDMEKCPYEAEVDITFVDNKVIHSPNNEYRGIDRATDVLSFPMVQYPTPSDFSILEEDNDSFNPETGELLLGDIVISVEKAAEQAAEYGHSIKREICFLTAHSMLHLLGYDHMTPEEAQIMEERQEKALAGLGITRE